VAKQSRKLDIDWLCSKLEKYLILWEHYEERPELRKQYSKPFIASNLLETMGALERIGGKGRKFNNLKNRYRNTITSSLQEVVEEAIKALRQTDYPASLNSFVEHIKSTLKRGEDYYMLKDEGENIILKRDELGLILHEVTKLKHGRRQDIAQIQNSLNQADKKLKESICYFSFLKEFAEDYRARFNIQDRNEFWWWFEIPERAVKISSLEEWESLLKLSHTMLEATEHYEKTEECEQFEEAIPGYIDRMLPKQLEAKFEKHLKSCEYCLYHVMDLYRITREMEGAKLEEVPEEIRKKAKEIVAPHLVKRKSDIEDIEYSVEPVLAKTVADEEREISIENVKAEFREEMTKMTKIIQKISSDISDIKVKQYNQDILFGKVLEKLRPIQIKEEIQNIKARSMGSSWKSVPGQDSEDLKDHREKLN